MSENSRSVANRSGSAPPLSLTKGGASSGSSDSVVLQDGGPTDIWRASEMGDADAVRRLLKKGASANALTDRKKTPLHYACIGASLEIVEMLIKAGADKLMRDKFDKAPLDYCKMFSEETKYGAFASLFECFELRGMIPGNRKRARRNKPALIPFTPPRVKRI